MPCPDNPLTRDAILVDLRKLAAAKPANFGQTQDKVVRPGAVSGEGLARLLQSLADMVEFDGIIGVLANRPTVPGSIEGSHRVMMRQGIKPITTQAEIVCRSRQ